MAREDLHFRLRIPQFLKERVEASAHANKRSMTAEIIAALEDKFGNEHEVVSSTEGHSTTFDVNELREFMRGIRDDLLAIRGKADK